jgi:hypothetical protein
LETYWKQLLTYTGNPYKVIDYWFTCLIASPTCIE